MILTNQPMERINKDYLGIALEFLIFSRYKFSIRKPPEKESKDILIVNPSMIGDFVAAIPAISSFISKRKEYNFDIMVSPPLIPLAKKIKGIRNVFGSKSSASREIENSFKRSSPLEEYSKIIVLKMSKEGYHSIKNIKAERITTAYRTFFLNYGSNLAFNVIMRRYPKQWKEIYFKMVNEEINYPNFDDIFSFDKKDLDKIKQLVPKTNKKLVIVHTRASWIMNRWSNDKWIKALREINTKGDFKFIFVGSSDQEKKDFQDISKALNFKVHSLIGKIDLKDLTILLRSSDYFLGIDSGPANIAHITDCRSLTILGAGPHVFLPWSEKDIVIDKSKGRGAYQRFFYKKKGFIHDIKPKEVSEKFITLVKNNP